MTPDRSDRFVDSRAPAEGSSQGSELQALEKKYSLDQAVALFKTERTESVLLESACNVAESLLNSKKVGRNLGNLSLLNNDTKVAIVAFTVDEPKLYIDFNSRSRDLSTSSWDSFPYKGMWLLLNKAILSYGNLTIPLTVYRGVDKVVNAAMDKSYCFCQIASASTKPEKAEKFKSDNGTMFIPVIKRGLGIRALSAFAGEEEYIIPAFDEFVVTNVKTVTQTSGFINVSSRAIVQVEFKEANRTISLRAI